MGKGMGMRRMLLTASNLDLASLSVEGIAGEVHGTAEIKSQADSEENFGSIAQCGVHGG